MTRCCACSILASRAQRRHQAARGPFTDVLAYGQKRRSGHPGAKHPAAQPPGRRNGDPRSRPDGHEGRRARSPRGRHVPHRSPGDHPRREGGEQRSTRLRPHGSAPRTTRRSRWIGNREVPRQACHSWRLPIAVCPGPQNRWHTLRRGGALTVWCRARAPFPAGLRCALRRQPLPRTSAAFRRVLNLRRALCNKREKETAGGPRDRRRVYGSVPRETVLTASMMTNPLRRFGIGDEQGARASLPDIPQTWEIVARFAGNLRLQTNGMCS